MQKKNIYKQQNHVCKIEENISSTSKDIQIKLAQEDEMQGMQRDHTTVQITQKMSQQNPEEIQLMCKLLGIGENSIR